MRSQDLDDFAAAYIAAALWATSDESTPAGGNPLDANYGPEDLAPEALAQIRADCAKFLEENGHLITDENCLYKGCSPMAYAGHDFLLTRNSHGCGFWETDDWQAEAGEILTQAAKVFGSQNIYVGDDGKLYVE